jgi:hypothetical protein
LNVDFKTDDRFVGVVVGHFLQLILQKLQFPFTYALLANLFQCKE